MHRCTTQRDITKKEKKEGLLHTTHVGVHREQEADADLL